MYAFLGKYHELWTFRPVFFIPVIVTTSPRSIVFHYHLIFYCISLSSHFHLSLFSTLFVSFFFFLTWSDDPSHFFGT